MALTVLGRERGKLLDRRAMALRRMTEICDKGGEISDAETAEFDSLDAELWGIHAKLRKLEVAMANPSMSDAEFDAYLEEKLDALNQDLPEQIAKLTAKAKALEGARASETTEAEWRAIHGDSTPYPYRTTSTPAAETWTDRDGRLVRVLSAREKLADLSAKPKLSLGKALVGAITGRWAGAEAERLAMGGGANTAGGFWVPEQLFATTIDLARAQAVLFRAGARIIPMQSDVLTIARITDDPELSFKAEHAEFAESQGALDAITISAQTYGTVVRLSRELASDAPNAAETIERQLAAALATSLDKMGLQGGGEGDSTAITGLSRSEHVGETTGVGTPAWEDLLDALADVEENNEVASAYIVSPAVKRYFAGLTTGDGTNAAKNWLPPPPDIAALSRFVTKNAPDTDIYLGDFSQVIYGVRLDAEIMTSAEADDAFKRFEVLVRIVWRGGFNIARPRAIHVLKGITGV